jgi:hypothetical protein
VPPLVAAVILPVLGAGAVLALVESEGGDLGGWTTGQAAAALAGLFVAPALLGVWFARRHGVFEAAAWGLVCIGVQVALVFGVGFATLGLGPG